MSGKEPQYPHYSYDIIKTDSLMIYSDNIEHIIVADTEATEFVVFLSSSK